MYMTPPPFAAAENARAHFDWKVIRQHVHRCMFIDVVREDEPHDRCFITLDLVISSFVQEITELHHSSLFSEVAAWL